MDQLAMANIVRWYGHVLQRVDDLIFRRALDFVVDGQGNKDKLKRMWKQQVEDDGVKVGLRRVDALC